MGREGWKAWEQLQQSFCIHAWWGVERGSGTRGTGRGGNRHQEGSRPERELGETSWFYFKGDTHSGLHFFQEHGVKHKKQTLSPASVPFQFHR